MRELGKQIETGQEVTATGSLLGLTPVIYLLIEISLDVERKLDLTNFGWMPYTEYKICPIKAY